MRTKWESSLDYLWLKAQSWGTTTKPKTLSSPTLSSLQPPIFFFCWVSQTLRVAFKDLQNSSCFFFTFLWAWNRLFSPSAQVPHTHWEPGQKFHPHWEYAYLPQPEIFFCTFDVWVHILPRPLFGQLIITVPFFFFFFLTCGTGSFCFYVLMCFVSLVVL